jgi:Concanavalin A-like lectin/glucanases superfamily
MSYESVKLALTPVAWYRNDELTGTVMTDSSGNDHHQDYLNLTDPTNPVVLGQASGVETVGTSRSVHGTNRIAHWLVTAPFDSTINFTWEAMVRQTMEHPSTRTIVSRNGQDNRLLLIGQNNISARFTLRIAGDIYAVDSDDNIALDTWYHLIGVRNGATMFLMVNGVVVGTRSDLPASTSIDTDTPDQIGYGSTSGGNTLQMLGNSEELTFYDYALTSSQGLAVYESMINSIQLNGYSNVISSAVLYSDVEPDPVSFPFRHNWVDDHVERLSFATGISTAKKGYEQGNAQRSKPRREYEITQVLKDDYERRLFRSKLNANQSRKWWWPVLEDRERLSGTTAIGTSVFTVATLYRDYEVGGYFSIRQLDSTGRVTHWEELLITGLTDTQVTTATGTVNGYTNAEVYPVRRAILEPSQSLRGHTDSVEETTISVRLVAEDEKAIPHRIVPWTPTITYEGHEVFDPAEWSSNDWSELREYGVDRAATTVDFGTGSFTVESDSLAAVETLTYRMLLEGKAQHAALLGWWYARAGSLTYLWVPTMQRDFDIVDTGLNTITVSGHNYFDNFASSEFRRDLAFVYNDNTLALRRIDSVTLDGANEEFELSNGLTPTLANLRSLSYLLFCRLDNDTLEIARVTDTKARFSWRFREMLASSS